MDCQARKSTQHLRNVAFRVALNLGDIVAVDLKIRHQKKNILYVMDLDTNFVLACLIDDKCPEEIRKRIVNLWLKAGHLGEFPIWSYLKVTKNMVLFLVLVKGKIFLYHLKAYL